MLDCEVSRCFLFDATQRFLKRPNDRYDALVRTLGTADCGLLLDHQNRISRRLQLGR